MSLPALPDMTGPVVKFQMSACRVCPQHSEWCREATKEYGGAYDWQSEHWRLSGHAEFYMFSITRYEAHIRSLWNG